MRARSPSFGLTVALGAWVLASASHAEIEPREMASGRQARTVKILAQGKVDHDTNVARVGPAIAAIQKIRPKDTIYAPSVNVDIVVPVGRQALFVSGSGSYQFHDFNKRLDRSEINVTGGLGNSIGRCGSVLGGTYQRGLSQLQDRALVQNVQNILTVSRASAGLTCVTPSGLGVLASATRDWGDNNLAQSRENNFVTSNAMTGILVGRPTTGGATVFAGYSETKYANRVSSTGGQEGYSVVNAGLTLERNLGGRIKATATLAYSWLSLAAPPIVRPGAPSDVGTEFNGLTYSGDLSYRASSRLQTSVAFARQISPTIISGRSYELQTNYTARVDYKIGSRFSVGLTLAQAETETQGGVPTGAQILTDSRTRSGQLALRYRQSDRVSIELSGGREDRVANNPDFEYTSDRAGIALTVNY